MADSPLKRSREAKKRKKKQLKAERKRQRKDSLTGETEDVTLEELMGLEPPEEAAAKPQES